MPRTKSSQRQKNKPFKGKNQKSAKKVSKQASTKTKPIAKTRSLRKTKLSRTQILSARKDKQNKKLEQIADKNQYLDSNTKSIVLEKIRNQPEIKIIVLIPGNREADTTKVLADIFSALQHHQNIKLQSNTFNMPFPTLTINPSHKSFIKNKMLLISGTSKNFNKNIPNSMPSMNSMLDLIKCADIVCPVLSCASTNIQKINLDPHEAGGAFDDLGYNIVNTLRSLGTPTICSIIQDVDRHQQRHHDKIQRLFRRFITSELGEENDKISYIKGQQYNKVLRTLDSTPIKKQKWKTQRGYMLVEKITKNNNQNLLTFYGYLKGNCVNANQLVHLTGFQDYQIEKIQIIDTKNKNIDEMNNNLIQYSTNPESLFPFSKQDNRDEDLLTAFEGLKLNLENNKQNKESMEMEDDGFVDEEDSEVSEDDQKYDLENYLEDNRKEEEKQQRYVQMQMRNQDELQFQDEVQYAAEQILREKYCQYQGLKNFKTSEWNHLENLPDQYDRIYTFKHYNRTHNAVINQNQSKGFAFPGFYIAVTLRNVNEAALLQNVVQNPTILTFLLKHEHKMTQLHLKVKRNPYYPSNINNVISNEKYLISMGFKRFCVSPIFSRIIQGTQKTKYTKVIKQDYESYFYCSFYYYNCFPSAPVHIYRVNQLNLQDVQPSPIMYGQLSKIDPLHCILQRIILTGYPFKIHKRRATIRFMFFNPKDVKYFKPVQVRTKMGLKGRIQQSLGTHGHMKVLFNDKIKHNDTVCMYLYRRVYPLSSF